MELALTIFAALAGFGILILCEGVAAYYSALAESISPDETDETESKEESPCSKKQPV